MILLEIETEQPLEVEAAIHRGFSTGVARGAGWDLRQLGFGKARLRLRRRNEEICCFGGIANRAATRTWRIKPITRSRMRIRCASA